MRKLTADLVKETSTTVGTGTLALVQSTGWARFNDRFSNNDRVYYSLRNGSNWEVGYGTYVSPHQLARTTILGTLSGSTWTDGGAALTLSGPTTVRAVAPETIFTNLWGVEPVLVSVNTQMVAQRCYIVQANGLTLTLPATPTAGDRVQIAQGAAAVTGTVVAPGTEKIHATAGNMTVDTEDFAFTLVYVDSSYGWKVL